MAKKNLLEARSGRCRSALVVPWPRLGGFPIPISPSLVRRSLRCRTRHSNSRECTQETVPIEYGWIHPFLIVSLPFNCPRGGRRSTPIRITSRIVGIYFPLMNLVVGSFPACIHQAAPLLREISPYDLICRRRLEHEALRFEILGLRLCTLITGAPRLSHSTVENADYSERFNETILSSFSITVWWKTNTSRGLCANGSLRTAYPT